MQIMIWYKIKLIIYISLFNRLLLSLNIVDCAGHQVNSFTGDSKRTAASNRLIQQGHLAAVSQSNTIELLEMKERICAGFMFKTTGLNCTFHIPKESLSISSVFFECKSIMINRCRRKQSEFFCSKGKQNALKINRQSSLINRFSDQFEISSSSVDCFLPDQDRFLPIYGSSIQSFSKCCSICQKAKLYAIELSSCKHKYYHDPLLESTFNDCCYSRLYQTKTLSIQNDPLKATLDDKLTASQLTFDLINNDQQINQKIIQSINHPTINPFNLQSNHINNPTINTQQSSIQNQPIQSSIQKTNEIYQQIQMNIDIEKVYLSKAKLMLSLKKTNDTLITNLSDDERNLLLKALDTSKLDYAIKHLTNLIHNNNTNINQQNSSLDPQSNQQNNLTTQIEFINRPLTSSKNLIDQLQLLLGTTINEKKWNSNDTVDYYSNLNQNNINFPIIQDENLNGSFLLEEDLDTQFNDEINFF